MIRNANEYVAAKVGNGTRVDTFSSSTRLLHGSPGLETKTIRMV